jgi:hypothetical protein
MHTLLAALVPALLGIGGYRYISAGDPWWLVAAAAAGLALAAVVTRRERRGEEASAIRRS